MKFVGVGVGHAVDEGPRPSRQVPMRGRLLVRSWRAIGALDPPTGALTQETCKAGTYGARHGGAGPPSAGCCPKPGAEEDLRPRSRGVGKQQRHGFGLVRGFSKRYAAAAGATGDAAPQGVISEATFHDLADQTLEDFQDQFEVALEGLRLEETDITYDSGVLELSLGALGTYVLNKQTPNKQVWLSSPVSGPFRYDYCVDFQSWVYKRDGHKLVDKLSEELTELLGKDVRIS